MTSRGRGVWSLFTGGPKELVTPPRGTIPGLDVLRSLAVILVVSGHLAVDYADHHGPFALLNFPLFAFGWTGVDLFFVLSGFLIGKQLWRELQRTETLDVPTFLIRRGLRIWPLYFFIVAVILFVVRPQMPIARAVPDIFFFSNYRLGIVAGGWSLSTEEHFYIVAPLLLLLTRTVRFERKWLVLASLFVLLPCVRYVTYQSWLRSGGEGIPPPDLLYWPIHTHADGLVFGLFLAWLAVAHPTAVAARSFARNLAVPLVLVLTGASLRMFEKHTFAYTGLALIYGGMALFMLRDHGLVSRWSSWRGFHLVSRLSYGMYLNHFFLLPWVMNHLDASGGGFDGARFAWLYSALLALSIGAAAVTFCVVEHPFLVLRERWLESRRKSASV